MIQRQNKNALRISIAAILSALILWQLRVATELTKTGYLVERIDGADDILELSSLPRQSRTAAAAAVQDSNATSNDPVGYHTSTDSIGKGGAGGIAVCLAFSDDNMILPEWLAYHYTTLPLRHLVLLLDPQSRTSPQDILDRWNQSNLVRSWIWTDSDIMDPYNLHKMNRLAEENTADSLHKRLKTRQKDFITACNQFFKRLSEEEQEEYDDNTSRITWVGHFDVDEFVVPNRVARWERKARKKKKLEPSRHLKGKLLFRDALKLRHKFLDPLFQQKDHQQVTALDVLNTARQYYRFPNCLAMGRWNHGSKQLKDAIEEESFLWKSKEGWINTSRLETLQYMRGDQPVRPTEKIMGKMIVDISQISMSNLTRAISPHKPLPEPHCGSSQINHMESALILNHYKGSWERYSFRNDTRRTYEQWQAEDARYWKADSTHYQIQKWLPRFVEMVGSEKQAAFLLGHTLKNIVLQ